MQGTVEKAQQELKRRGAQFCNHIDFRTTQARIELWYERARRTVGIAQGLEQAATESIEIMEAVLCSQSWDHRLVTKLHDGKLREMELEPIQGDDLTLGDYTDKSMKGPRWQRSQQVEQVELQQGRLEVFMAKIRRQERANQYEMAKEKKKTLQLKHQETTIDSSNINA